MATQLDLSHSSPSDFEMLTKLGEGAYGSVYKAKHVESGVILAIKVVLVGADTQEEIQKEINFMKNFHCRQIVAYYGSAIHGESMWIMMDYCGLGSLRDVMDSTDTLLTEPEIAQTVAETLKGLKYLHENRVIHRDIKAANILINEEGVIKLADFGVSEQLKSDVMKTLNVIGTPLWMAPEVIADARYNTVADIWSLGITAIELAQGYPPNTELNPFRAMFLIPRNPPPKLANPSTFSPDFNDFISKCLIKNPTKRWKAEKLLTHPFITSHVFSKDAHVILPNFVFNVQTLMAATESTEDDASEWSDYPVSGSAADSRTNSPGLFQFKGSTDSLPTLSALMGSDNDSDIDTSEVDSGRASPNNYDYGTLVIKPKSNTPQESLLKRVTSPTTERHRSGSDSPSPEKTSPTGSPEPGSPSPGKKHKKLGFSRAISQTLTRKKISKPEISAAHLDHTPTKHKTHQKKHGKHKKHENSTKTTFKPSAFQTMLFGKKGPDGKKKKAKKSFFTLKPNRNKKAFMTIGAPATNKRLTTKADRRSISGHVKPTSTSDTGDSDEDRTLTRQSSVIINEGENTYDYDGGTLVLGGQADEYALDASIIDDVMDDETLYSLERKPLWQQRMIRFCAYMVIPEFPAAYVYQNSHTEEFESGEQHFGELKDNATHGLHGVPQDVSTSTPEPVSFSIAAGTSWVAQLKQKYTPETQTLNHKIPNGSLIMDTGPGSVGSMAWGSPQSIGFSASSGASWITMFDDQQKIPGSESSTTQSPQDNTSIFQQIKFVSVLFLFVFCFGFISSFLIFSVDENTTPLGIAPPHSFPQISPPETGLDILRHSDCPTPICPKCTVRCPPPKKCPICPLGNVDPSSFDVEFPPQDTTSTTIMRSELQSISPSWMSQILSGGAAPSN